MKKIIDIRHVANDIGNDKIFSTNICEGIDKMQAEGLEVEIQYQQSADIFSALIIGRKDEG